MTLDGAARHAVRTHTIGANAPGKNTVAGARLELCEEAARPMHGGGEKKGGRGEDIAKRKGESIRRKETKSRSTFR